MIAAGVLLLCAQDPQPYRLTAELAVAREGGRELFVVSGETDLPDGAIVRVDVFRAQTYEGRQYAGKMARVSEGRYEARFAVFPGATPPGKFEAFVRFDPGFQMDGAVAELAEAAGVRGPIEVKAALVVGRVEDFVKARDAHRKALGAMFAAARERFERAAGMFESGAGSEEVLAAIENARREIRRLFEEREAQRVADFHFGVESVAVSRAEQVRQTAEGALNVLEEVVRGKGPVRALHVVRDVLADTVRGGLLELDLPAGDPRTIAGVAEELLKVLRGALGAPSWDERELFRRRADELVLWLARYVEPASYWRLEDLVAAIGEVFDAMATGKAVEEKLKHVNGLLVLVGGRGEPIGREAIGGAEPD